MTQTAPTPPPTIDLLGFPFANVTEQACVAYILGCLDAGQGGWVVTPNLDILRMLSASHALWEFIRNADLLIADGMPLVWASKIMGTPLPERVAGSSLIFTLSEGAAHQGRSIYFLGGDEGTADAAAAELTRRYPGLLTAGTYCPPFGFERDADEMERIRRAIQSAQPDIVFVALGCPKQERLIEQIRPMAPDAWYLGVGISFSYVCGEVKRAPKWMRRSGLEWVFRMAQEPGRLVKRYIRDDIPFAVRLATLSVLARLPFTKRGWGLRPRAPSKSAR